MLIARMPLKMICRHALERCAVKYETVLSGFLLNGKKSCVPWMYILCRIPCLNVIQQFSVKHLTGKQDALVCLLAGKSVADCLRCQSNWFILRK